MPERQARQSGFSPASRRGYCTTAAAQSVGARAKKHAGTAAARCRDTLADAIPTRRGAGNMAYPVVMIHGMWCTAAKIGRASWRERVCQYVEISGVAVY